MMINSMMVIIIMIMIIKRAMRIGINTHCMLPPPDWCLSLAYPCLDDDDRTMPRSSG